MNFQQLKNNDQIVESALIDFCIRSKPYDFCSIKNNSVRSIQIKKYYEFLVKECDIFYCKQNGSIKFFIALSHEESCEEIQFIFGDPIHIVKAFKAFREFYWNRFDLSLPFAGTVKRQHQLKAYLNFIKRKDPDAKISLDNGEILVLYTRDGV